MITNLKLALITTVVLLQATMVNAQRDTTLAKKDSVTLVRDSIPARQHIAVFIPLYLDSAFDAAGNYRYDKNIPKYMSPGLEFWQGVQLAIDSLQQEGIQADIHIYDTRSTKNKFENIVSGEEIKKMHLIIEHVTVNEAARLAALAAQLNIPF